LRERFRRGGGEALNDYELLELLLTFALPRKDVKGIAKDLIERFGTLQGVFDASSHDLESVDGMGPAAAALIRVAKELRIACLRETLPREDALSSPEAVTAFAREKIAGLPNEAFMVVYLNVKNKVLAAEVVQEGTVDRAAVYPRRLAERALAHHAASVILVHNHPSGQADPSWEDRDLTSSIVRALNLLDIAVVDHVIVGKAGHFSFRENRLI
jgi:DNA repair protein RadC